jgi:hypothetical protein
MPVLSPYYVPSSIPSLLCPFFHSLLQGMHVNGWALSNYFARGRTVSWGQRNRTGNPVATAYRAGDDKLFWLIGFEAGRHWPPTMRAIGKHEWLEGGSEYEKYKSAGARRKLEQDIVAEMDVRTLLLKHSAAQYSASLRGCMLPMPSVPAVFCLRLSSTVSIA